MKILPVLFLFVLGVGLILYDFHASKEASDGIIQRNDYGKGSRTESLEAQVEGESEKIPLEIEVKERQYQATEVQEFFDKILEKLDKKILGANESFRHVDQNLNLVSSIEGEPVEISWELDRYDLMNVKGEIMKEAIDPEGETINLKAVLTYTENEAYQTSYQQAVCVFPKTAEAKDEVASEISEKIQKNQEENASKETFALPKTVEGKKISYYFPFNSRGLVLVVMSILILILLWLLGKQRGKELEDQRKEQLLLDYPELVNKLTLFLGAGMTVKRAWRKILQDYENSLKDHDTRYVYEEMKLTYREIESGVPEAESYENFGRRCNLPCYLKLGALLSQNLRKGVKGLSEMLHIESLQAFEERKARAKRKGEEAGTKLLLPMFMMLAIVLVIVIMPAFLTLQIY